MPKPNSSRLNEAYQVIGDAEKRKKYDELGADWEHGVSQEEMMRRYARQQSAAGAGARGGADFGGGDFSDFFSQFFGGGGAAVSDARRRTQPRRFVPRIFRLRFRAPEPARAPDLHAEVRIRWSMRSRARSGGSISSPRTNAPPAAAAE